MSQKSIIFMIISAKIIAALKKKRINSIININEILGGMFSVTTAVPYTTRDRGGNQRRSNDSVLPTK